MRRAGAIRRRRRHSGHTLDGSEGGREGEGRGGVGDRVGCGWRGGAEGAVDRSVAEWMTGNRWTLGCIFSFEG